MTLYKEAGGRANNERTVLSYESGERREGGGMLLVRNSKPTYRLHASLYSEYVLTMDITLRKTRKFSSCNAFRLPAVFRSKV